MNAELGAVGNRVLEALLNGALQGLLVAGMLWVGLRVLPGLNAATRYAVQFVAMLMVAALPVAQLAKEFWPEPRAASQAPSAAVETIIADLPENFAPVVYEAPKRDWELTMPAEWSLGLLGVWLLVVAWRLALLLRQCMALYWIKRGALSPLEALQARFAALREEMRVRRGVRLGLSQSVHAPIAAGFFQPRVLLPERLARAESPSRLDGILRHELAHVRRWDDWTNLVQQIVHALFFFHPGVCWLSKRLTIEREIACDDHVLAALSNRREYALLLAEFASRMHGQPLAREWSAAPGAWSRKGQLKERIHMILNRQRNASTRLAGASAGMLTVGAALVALLMMQAGPRVALADEAKSEGTAEITVEADVAVEVSDDTPPAAGLGGGGGVVAGPRVKERRVVIHGPGAVALAAQPGQPPQPPQGVPHPHPAPHAAPARGPLPPGDPRNRDLERRLERLERMVEQLAGGKPRVRNEDMKFNYELKGEGWGPEFHEKMAKMHKDLEREFSPDKMAKIHEEARKAAEKGAREAERAVRDLERARKDGPARAEARVEIRRDGEPNARRKAIEEKRRALERQMHALEREINELERQEERIEQEQERVRERAEQERERAQRDRERANQERERAERERERAEKEREKNPDNVPGAESPKQRS